MWPGLQVTLQSLPVQVIDSIARHEIVLKDDTFQEDYLTVLDMAGVSAGPLPLPFDEVIQRMKESGTIYSEGDGSFALCGDERCSAENQNIIWFGRNGQLISAQENPDWFTDPEQRSTWKIEGNLFDGDQTLNHCTLTGYAPVDQWQYLLKLITGSQVDRSVFQMQQLGIHCMPADLFKLFDN